MRKGLAPVGISVKGDQDGEDWTNSQQPEHEWIVGQCGAQSKQEVGVFACL